MSASQPKRSGASPRPTRCPGLCRSGPSSSCSRPASSSLRSTLRVLIFKFFFKHRLFFSNFQELLVGLMHQWAWHANRWSVERSWRSWSQPARAAARAGRSREWTSASERASFADFPWSQRWQPTALIPWPGTVCRVRTVHLFFPPGSSDSAALEPLHSGLKNRQLT